MSTVFKFNALKTMVHSYSSGLVLSTSVESIFLGEAIKIIGSFELLN